MNSALFPSLKRHGSLAPSAEERLARRATAWLDISARSLPHEIEQRLGASREQALASARHARASRALASDPVALGWGSAAALGQRGGGTPWWARCASLAPAVLLAAGLIAIDRLHETHRVMAAAEIDTALLADDLPPSAYSDPGFAEFVRQSPP